MSVTAENPPEEFRRAQEQLRSITPRPEIEVVAAPAPQRLAPYALAVTADVVVHDEEVATGRLVVLHDPAGQDAWEGRWRVVVFARADTEPESADESMLCDVGWSYLEEALADNGVVYVAQGGTVTRTQSQTYGSLAGRAAGGQLEVRASWTPIDGDVGVHVTAWLDLLAMMAGLEPRAQGVTLLHR